MEKAYRVPEKFIYSQQSLSAFEQCPGKFGKRYIENLKWESILDVEQKKAIERGRDFHLLAKRYFMGIGFDEDYLHTEDNVLDLWLRNLKQAFRLEQGMVYLPEHAIIMRAGKLKLQAIFDLVVVKEDRLEIWDWKTHNSHTAVGGKNTGKRLEKSIQTKMYLFLLREYAANTHANPFKNYHNISMHYWQPEPAGIIADIGYDEKAHEESRNFFENMIASIENYNWNEFDKILYGKNCRYCEFNWLCNEHI